MTEEMKIFLTNQKYFATMGITRHQTKQRQPFNTDNLLSSFKFCLCVTLLVNFLACEANTFKEYTESIYFTSATISIANIFFVFVWNMDDFFDFCDGWEKCAEQS